jgi:glycosyltransferase involved in cell wall biosynthesis
MHVGVDATSWPNRRGYGRYVRSLLRALLGVDSENRYTLVLDSPEPHAGLPPKAECRIVATSVPTVRAATASGRRSVRDLYRVGRALSDSSFDVLFFPTLYSYVPVRSGARKIVAIHDTIPETFPAAALGGLAPRAYWAAKSRAARAQANAIVTPSEYTRRCLLERFRLSPDRIFVLGGASDAVFRVLDDPQPTPRLRALGVDEGCRPVAFVGGFSPHKNVGRLISAFDAAGKRFPETKLILVGDLTGDGFTTCLDDLRAQVKRLADPARVVFAGHLPDEDLVVLLNRAALLALPSWMEGFGLPAVEAASCGCPVVATTESPLADLLGEGALYVHPNDGDGLEAALTRLLGDERLRAGMSRAGRAAARRMTWDDAAQRFIDVLRRLAAIG